MYMYKKTLTCEELVPNFPTSVKLVPNYQRCEELVLNYHIWQRQNCEELDRMQNASGFGGIFYQCEEYACMLYEI